MRALYFGAQTTGLVFDEHQPKVLSTKVFDTSMPQLAGLAKCAATRLISIFCDWYFDGAEGRVNHALSGVSDSVVVQTQYMADEFERHFGRRPILIEEAMEYPRAAPRFAPGHVLKLAWYGRDTNFDTLIPGLRRLAGYRKRPIHVLMISNAHPAVDEKIFKTSSFPSNMIADFETWSLQAQYDAMQWCDFVFLPGLDDPGKQVNGHNRLVEAINAGRLALVHPQPQYRELGDYCWCRGDYSAESAGRSPIPIGSYPGLFEARNILIRFAPEVIAARWRSEIERVMAL